MVKEIVTDIEQLSVVSDEIDCKKENKLLREIILDLKDTIRDKELLCLTAIQIGYDKRVVVMNFGGTLKTFVNPMIIKRSKKLQFCNEKCTSLVDAEFIVPRHETIEVIFQTPLAEIKHNRFVGLAAKMFQHCCEHLDGILSCDVGLQIDEEFKEASEEEQNELLNYFFDSLDARISSLNEEIASDPDLQKLKNNLDIRDKVASGKLMFVAESNKEGETTTDGTKN